MSLAWFVKCVPCVLDGGCVSVQHDTYPGAPVVVPVGFVDEMWCRQRVLSPA